MSVASRSSETVENINKYASLSEPSANDAANDAPAVRVSKRQLFAIFSGLILAMVLAALDQSIVSTALPTIASDLGGLNHMTWVVTAFMLTSTISAPIYGKLSDMYGRRPLFAISIVTFLLASALCGAAHTMFQLILFRGLQGLGGGGLITLSQTVIGALVTPRERGRYQGLFTGAFAVSSVTGPLLGGLITSQFSWRWVFFINLPLGLVSLALVMITLPRIAAGQKHQIDYAGAALLTGGTAAMLLLLNAGAAGGTAGGNSSDTSGGAFSLASPLLWALAVAAIAAFSLLIRVERRAAEPIIDLTLFRVRAYTVCVFASGMMAFAMMGSLVFLPLYFQLVLGQTPAESGLMMLPQVIAMLLSSVIGGQISTRTRRFTLLLSIGVGLEAGGLIYFALLAHLGASVPWFLSAAAVLGMGMGIGMPNATVVVQNAVPARALGAATATMSFIRSLGGSLGVALSGGVMALALHKQLAALPEKIDVSTLAERGMAAIHQMSALQQAQLVDAYRSAIGASLVTGGGIMMLAFLLVVRLAWANRGRADIQ